MSNDYDSSHYPAGFDQEISVETAATLYVYATDALAWELWRTTPAQRATLHRMVDFAAEELQRPDCTLDHGTPAISMARHNDVEFELSMARIAGRRRVEEYRNLDTA